MGNNLYFCVNEKQKRFFKSGVIKNKNNAKLFDNVFYNLTKKDRKKDIIKKAERIGLKLEPKEKKNILKYKYQNYINNIRLNYFRVYFLNVV